MADTVVETKQCLHCQSSFDITQGDLDFYAKVSPKFGDYVAEIPSPTLCPDCRQRRRLAFRNERQLYVRECDASKKPIVSLYKPSTDCVVYNQQYRWSDNRDPLDYGMEFDFSRTFTEQFAVLMGNVPRMSLINDYTLQVNSEYINFAGPTKNSYLIFETNNCEDCAYSYLIWDSQDCLDCFYMHRCSGCYDCFSLSDCHDCISSIACKSSSFLDLCSNCTNCSDCLMCHGLEGKQYHIQNVAYMKEAYQQKKEDMLMQSRSMLQVMQDSRLQENNFDPHFVEYGNEGVDGSSLTLNSYNASHVSLCQHVENSKYCTLLNNSHDCYDYFSRGEHSYGMYEVHNCGNNCSYVCFSELCWMDTSHLFYCDLCPVNNSHLFGCVGLRNKEYCIFNKQYTKEEYNILVPKIIEHMKQTGERGEFFHPSLSPFGYNETVAQEYFPVEKGELDQLGYQWSNYEAPAPQVDKIIPGEKLPSQGCAVIYEQKPQFLADISRYAIRCQESGKLFRLIPQEIAFYTKHNLPLPRKHPDVRHQARMELRK